MLKEYAQQMPNRLHDYQTVLQTLEDDDGRAAAVAAEYNDFVACGGRVQKVCEQITGSQIAAANLAEQQASLSFAVVNLPALRSLSRACRLGLSLRRTPRISSSRSRRWSRSSMPSAAAWMA